MPIFALIAEGHTDQVVLERIIEQACAGVDDVDINYLQPLLDATDLAESNFGGWELVLDYCRHGFNDALATNDFVVIHIDTDMGDHPNFNVALTAGGKDRHYKEIFNDTKKLLIEKIGEDIFENHKERVIFAISIHSIESWILLCLFDRDEPKGSFERLNKHLIRGNDSPLLKDGRRYKDLVRHIKSKRLKEIRRKDGSLPTFLLDLDASLLTAAE